MPAYELTVRSRFSAAHRIRLPNGELEPSHGHNWRVEVFVRAGRLDSCGLAVDFADLRVRLDRITGSLDMTDLNHVAGLGDPGPTTELIARHICERFAAGLPGGLSVRAVRVWETEDRAAAYLPDSDLPGPETL